MNRGVLDKEETGRLAVRATKEYILVYRVNEWLCVIKSVPSGGVRNLTFSIQTSPCYVEWSFLQAFRNARRMH